jgi:hypothetical protein
MAFFESEEESNELEPGAASPKAKDYYDLPPLERHALKPVHVPQPPQSLRDLKAETWQKERHTALFLAGKPTHLIPPMERRSITGKRIPKAPRLEPVSRRIEQQPFSSAFISYERKEEAEPGAAMSDDAPIDDLLCEVQKEGQIASIEALRELRHAAQVRLQHELTEIETHLHDAVMVLERQAMIHKQAAYEKFHQIDIETCKAALQDSQPPRPPTPPPPCQSRRLPPPKLTLTMEFLCSIAPPERNRVIGEHLYPKVQQLKPRLAGKITGMLLGLDNRELLELLWDNCKLWLRVDEAVRTLNDYHKTQQVKGHRQL